MKNKNKLFIMMFMFVMMFSFISAADCTKLSEKPFKQYDTIELKQTCDSCTYVNLSSVTYPNSTINHINQQMTKNGVDYNYSYSNTDDLGMYYYVVAGDKDGGFKTETFCFEITSTGESLGLNQGITLIAMFGIISLFFGLARVFGKNKWKISLFFDILAVLMGVVLLNSIKIVATESTNLGTMGEMGFVIGIIALIFLFLYLFIYALIEVFFYFKKKRRDKWGISEDPY